MSYHSHSCSSFSTAPLPLYCDEQAIKHHVLYGCAVTGGAIDLRENTENIERCASLSFPDTLAGHYVVAKRRVFTGHTPGLAREVVVVVGAERLTNLVCNSQ